MVCCELWDHWAAEIQDFLAAGLCGFSQNTVAAFADLWKHLFLWTHSNAIFCHCEPFLGYQKTSNPHWQALLYSLTPILCSQLWLHTSLCSISLAFSLELMIKCQTEFFRLKAHSLCFNRRILNTESLYKGHLSVSLETCASRIQVCHWKRLYDGWLIFLDYEDSFTSLIFIVALAGEKIYYKANK